MTQIEENLKRVKSKRGFASMDPDRRKEVSRKGGKSPRIKSKDKFEDESPKKG